jgi:hypothetical protein
MAVENGMMFDPIPVLMDIVPIDGQEIVSRIDAEYRNRVWDTQVIGSDKYHYWNTNGGPDVNGSSYDGPGTWGVDTSDFCVVKYA